MYILCYENFLFLRFEVLTAANMNEDGCLLGCGPV
jgi:hypothetical protein